MRYHPSAPAPSPHSKNASLRHAQGQAALINQYCPFRPGQVAGRNMANKVTTISDLLQRVASSCLTHRLPGGHALEDYDCDYEEDVVDRDEEEKPKPREEEEEQGLRIWEEDGHRASTDSHKAKIREMECFMHEVFDAVSAMKRAYVGLQAAHSPWDPDKMRVVDAAVVAEFRKLGRLLDRFRRECFGPPAAAGQMAEPLRDAVAPYEAAIEDLKRQLKAKDAEVNSVKEKLRTASLGSAGRKGRLHSGNRAGSVAGLGPTGTPTPELFEAYMERVKSASKSFTIHLLSLMRSAHWDTTAAIRSFIGGGIDASEDCPPPMPYFEPRHAKYALESYVNRNMFQGFENEAFYLEGSLSSLINPAEYRRDCLAQFCDMRAMEPEQLLGILPGCPFGRFATTKYLATVHDTMDASLFGSASEQRRQVMAGGHPRTGFYGEFLRLAKAVWLLHLLAFALDPAPAQFEVSKGAEFHPQYMESVVRFQGGRANPGSVVSFPVGPGFKLGNGSVVRARVYLAPRGQASMSSV